MSTNLSRPGPPDTVPSQVTVRACSRHPRAGAVLAGVTGGAHRVTLASYMGTYVKLQDLSMKSTILQQ